MPIANSPEASWPSRNDRWQGWQVQREQLLAFIDSKGLENVWYLSGDIHVGTIHRLEAMGTRRRFFEVCVGPSNSSVQDCEDSSDGPDDDSNSSK